MESLHYLLMKAHSTLNRRILSQAAGLGLSPGQPKVLEYLAEHEGSDQKTIAAYCEIEQATVGSILTRMETAGLIERRQIAGNRRSLYIYLTDKGKRAAVDMAAVFTEADQAAARKLSPAETEELKAMLKKICTALNLEREC